MCRTIPYFNSGFVMYPRRLDRHWVARRLLPAAAMLGLAACGATVDQRGNLPEREKLAQIRPGSTTRDEVTKILGTPSSVGIFDD